MTRPGSAEAWRAPALPVLFVVRLWQRSLLTRVVTATLLLAGTVTVVLGVVLLHQVGQGLLDAQRRQALGELEAGLQTTQDSLLIPASVPSDQLNVAVKSLQARSGSPASPQFDVLVLPTQRGVDGFAGGAASPAVVPSVLRERVAAGSEAYAYTRGPDGHGLLLVGAPLSTAQISTYELYYAFPLASQEQTLALVRGRLLAIGVALVLLLALVAGLVARQVVTPVRLAARVAGRLAAGRLTERLTVRGSDDLARLARSFNEMAAGLQRQIGQLEELSRVQRRFTADVSHELRTPLTTVRMAADVLHEARSSFPPAIARAAELLQGELDRFEGLLADLLEISRYDANAAVLDAEPVDLVELVRQQVRLVAPIAAERRVDLDLTGLPAGPVLAEADPRRVARVLRNLLANAVEHGEGHPVEVCLAANEVAVAVRVRDHGAGLRPEDATRVFDRFWRADPSRARHSGGTGLGLSIAMEDARLHGGWLQAAGWPGRGTAFRLVLPREAGTEVRSSPLPLEDLARGGRWPGERPAGVPA